MAVDPESADAASKISHAEWYRSHPQFAHVPRELRSAGTRGVLLVRGHQPAGTYRRPAGPELVLQLLLTDGMRARADHGEGWWPATSRRGHLVLSPGSTEVAYNNSGALTTLAVILPPEALLRSDQGAVSPDFGLLHRQVFEDELCRVIVQRLWDESTAGNPSGALFADSAVQTLATALHLRAGRKMPSAPPRGGLTPWQVRRVTECLEEHLAEDISLAALAELVNLSPNHFCTAFRVSLGEPPHRYLVRRRIERAKEMLADPRLSITEVALAVGFGSSAHFATAFRKQMGVTPSAYRRERLL